MAPTPGVVPADYPGCPATVTEAQAQGRALRSPRWGLWDVLFMSVGAIASAFAVGGGLEALGAPWALTTFAAIIAPWLFFLGWPLLITRLRGNGPVIDLGLRITWRDAALGLAAGLLMIPLASAIGYLTTLVFGDFTSAAGDVAQEFVSRTDPWMWVLVALSAGVGGPLAEEVAFRGLTFAAVRKRGLPGWATVIVTAAFFALFHFEPVRFPLIFALGLVLGFLRARTGRAGASIVAHMVHNLPGAVLIAMGLPG